MSQGGCTLSLRAMRARRSSIINSVSNRMRSDNKNRNQINHRRIRATVDGIGGEFHNDLQTRVFNGCRSGMGRQALANPRNWVARCPGSLLTNLSDLHPRARLERPTSAEEFTFEMRSRLDHPRSHHCDRERPPERTGPPSRRKVEAARGTTKNFEMDECTPGFILAQERLIIYRAIFHGSGAGLS